MASTEELLRGRYFIGVNGSGKSSALACSAIGFIRNEHGLVLLDPHRDLANLVQRHVPPEYRSRVRVLDIANKERRFGLNPFECRDSGDEDAVEVVLDQVVQLFSKLWGSEITATPMLADYLRAATLLMILTGGTLVQLQRFLRESQGAYRRAVLAGVPPSYSYVREFWEEHFAGTTSQAVLERQRNPGAQALIRRVRWFVDSPVGRHIFAQQKSSIDWHEALTERWIVLVKLDPQLRERTAFVGGVLLNQILNAAFSRADEPVTDRTAFAVLIDEYHRFGTDATVSLYTEGRKYGFMTTIAHQFRDQLSEQMKGATLQCGSFVIFRVTPPDAVELSGLYDAVPPPGEVRGSEPVRAPTPQVVRDLLTNGHRDSFVRSFTEGSLRPLQQHIDNPKLKHLHNFNVNGRGYLTSKESLRQGMAQIDRFLTLANEGRLSIQPADQGPMLAEIFASLRAYFGLGEESRFLTALDFNLAEWQTISLARHEEEMETPVVVPFEEVKAKTLDAWMGLTAMFKTLDSRFDETVNLLLTNPNWEGLEWLRGLPRQTVEDTTAFAWNLLKVAEVLKRDPILSNTGQYIEQRDRPRSITDYRLEFANKLTQLPTGHAWLRGVVTGFYQMKQLTGEGEEWEPIILGSASVEESPSFYDVDEPPES